MNEREKLINFYKYGILFILVNAFFIYHEMLYFAIIPFILLIALASFISLDKIFFLIVLFVPVSVPLREFVPNLDVDFYIPTEPLIVGMLLMFIYKLLIEKHFDKNILRHPVSIAILINLAWIFITSLTSSMPLVSIKFFISRVWFVVIFYFISSQLFKNIKNYYRFIWLYVASFIFVIFYATYKQLGFGLFNQEAANYVVSPLYADHTSYGAMIAMFLPILLAFGTVSKYSSKTKFLIWIVIAIYIFAFVFSYTRAAWISFAGAIGVLILVLLKINYKILISGIILVLILFFSFRTEIILNLTKNKQDSSKSLEKHIESISNISTDASNLERINRWSCALRMFEERPVLGFGPGTYKFLYAPFQYSYEKTIISTNAGNRGNAHSEYIGPLAESGFFGMITFLVIVISSIITALKLYKFEKNKEYRMLVLSLFLGLVTYFIHGFLNNFLDTDKASVPFWGFISMIVSLDVYHRNKTANE